MTPRNGQGLVWLGRVLVALFVLEAGVRAADPPGAKTTTTRPINPRAAVEPAAPVLPAELVAAMQEGRFADAGTTLTALAEKATTDEERAYYALIRGVAERLGGQGETARRVLAAALEAAPQGPWAAKLRAELAAAELAAGHPDAAEALARAEAESLLAGARKDRLAEVYHAFARALLKPSDPVTPADPNGAYDLLVQARGLAKGEALHASLLLSMARASQAAGNHPRAIQDLQLYLKESPKGPDRAEARYRLGEAQRNTGQALAARLTWADLARELAASGKPLSKGDDEYRARALYGVALTHGVPNPPNDASLNLGVAALKRFLAEYPANPLAVGAAYQVGASYLARGKGQEALEALKAFLNEEGFRAETDEAKRDLARLLMTATYQVGQVLQGQEKFDEAIAAWRGYLAKFPDGPQSADAQRAILDTQLLTAAEHLRHGRYAEARAAWRAFATVNPLDARVPQLLYEIGESSVAEKQYDDAIAAWAPLLSKFPASEPAAHAQFRIATIFEDEKGDPEAAIERYKKVVVEPWRARALERIGVMEAKALTIVTPRAFRSGERAKLKVSTRNLESLTFTAYKLDAEAYFRKKHVLGGVESLDISLVQPDAEWTLTVPGYAKYKPIEKEFELEKVKIPGIYVVKVTDEKSLQATTLVIGSDLEAIVKTSNEQVLVFAQDVPTGKGRAGARVIIADGEEVILEAKTGADGVLLKTWDKPRQPGSQLHYLVLDGPSAAGSGLGVPEKVAQGLTARAYLYTDRPAYRPGQQVAIRGVVREVVNGQYADTPGAEYRLEVSDSRGRRIVARPVKLSAFGTFHESLPLDSGAPVGTYQVRVYQPGASDFSGQFEVQAYRLEKLDLAFDLKKSVYFRGETIKGDVVARYQYGAPAAGRPIAVQFPDGRVVRGLTNAEGKYPVEFTTEGFAEEQALQLMAQLPEDGVGAVERVLLVVRAFSIDVKTARDVYLDGESFPLTTTTSDAQGKPTGETLSIAVLKRVTLAGRVTEREVLRKELKTDPATGHGETTLKVDDDQGGAFIVRVAGVDRFGNPVVTDRALTISGKKDETKLRILADRQTFKVGEEATVNLHSRGRAGTALLAWEADRILSYKLVSLVDGDNAVAWAIDGAQFPNFTLTAARMSGTHFDEARLDVRVERDLRVKIQPTKPAVGPGESVEVEVTTEDQLGRPVAAEVALALVDESLLRLYNDNRPPIGQFFYNQTRTGAFTTVSTNTFKYTPATTPVSEAVVEEAERDAALLANEAAKVKVLQDAQKQAIAPAPAAAPRGSALSIPNSVDGITTFNGAPATAGMGGMGGGMGGMGGKLGMPAGMMPGITSAEKEAGAVDFFTASDFAAPGLDSKSESFGRAVDLPEGGLPSGRYANVLGEDRVERDFEQTTPTLAKRMSRGRNPVQVRQQFVETAYWNPSVVTDKQGKVKITFPAPMALSRYRFSARGVSAGDTLVGQTTADLAVRKDFFVDLKSPATLTQGDKPRFLARLHHVGAVGTVNLKLGIYAGGKDEVFPKTIEVKADGVDEVLFEPFEVPDGENVRLTLSATLGASKDELVVEVPIRPWGVQSFASASGTASDGATVFVGLPAGRAYEGSEMLVVLSPTLRRMLIELALGQDAYPLGARINTCIFPPPPSTTADRAGELLAATQALSYLKTIRATEAPEAERLTSRIRGLVAELIAAQGEDGGWPWVGGPIIAGKPANPSDRATSSRVVWALATAEPHGLLTDPGAVSKAAVYLTMELAKLGATDHETRALLLHALSTRKATTFEQANALHRLRQGLSDAALGYLALTFVNLDRATIAGEVLDMLGPRAKSEPTEPGHPRRRFWTGDSRLPFNKGPVEATALAALAFAQARPQDPVIAEATDWLLAHRQGTGWQPRKAQGPALAALTAFYGRAQGAEDRYQLIVTVNETEVSRLDVVGPTEGKAILVPRDALKPGAKNRIRFDVEGRGTFGYAVTLTGFARDLAPDQDRTGRTAVINQRVYLPAPPELDGKALPMGFGVAVDASPFENKASQVAVGGKARVRIDAFRNLKGAVPEWERDFLIVEEHLPAGTTLIDGSVQSQAGSYTLADDILTFYFAPNQWPGAIQYDVYGYLPGRYRALPASIRSAYEPGRSHLGPAGDLKVLAPGEANTDAYKPTPDELFARGKTQFDAGRLAEAADPLGQLFAGYTLRDDIAKDAARMLLLIHIREYDARKVVQYFEVVKEKAPDLVISFDDLKVIGRAYRDIGEFERAYLVWRGVAEASYLEDARVGEVLRQRGKTLEGVAYLIALWREYPDSASIDADFFGLSQVLAQLAGKAVTDPTLRRELADAGVTRSELLLQAIRLIQASLARTPKSPLADEASLALVGAFLELGDDEAVVKLSARFAKLYPKSTFLDSFQYSEALGDFHLGRYDRAIAVAEAIAKATYKDADGVEQPSPNKWQATYILGQIYDARRQPGKALEYYRQVAERFTDAAGAVRSFTRKDLKLAEVTVVRPVAPPAVAGDRPGLRSVTPTEAKDAKGTKPGFTLDYRNVAEAEVKVYPVDLMRLYLTRRNLDEIAGIDLAGITPLLETKVTLGKGEDYENRTKTIELPLEKEGAYLIMVRGDELYASGIVLVTPLEVEVLEEPEAGRVRVTVRDARTKDFVPKVLVKVIGGENEEFASGETDLRGVYVAEALRGSVTAVARRGTAQYAFYRGTTHVGAPPAPPAGANAPAAGAKPTEEPSQSLDENLRIQNNSNQMRQIERLQNRYNQNEPGGAAVKGFK
ncbi:MG2 domain-containing protein [Singulisphaera sp. GP187]|uniref:MG2 domain-containing protein n=1 Tax=Singulisphaera sp. GP187 TaxID=1882752 RepID=UPI000941A36D|nr:MG2 domain-containing protein [Singulisphaera sp. GP187]